MKKIHLLTSLFVLFSLLVAVVPAQAAGPGSFYMEKACSASGCTITYADGPFVAFVGTQVTYGMYNYGSDSADNFHMTATITLTANSGDTASGIVSWVYHNGDFTGHISLQSGTGEFAGVHAQGVIGLITWPSLFSFTGSYLIAP